MPQKSEFAQFLEQSSPQPQAQQSEFAQFLAQGQPEVDETDPNQKRLKRMGEGQLAARERSKRYQTRMGDALHYTAPSDDPVKIGAELVGGMQGATFNLADELEGLFNKEKGQQSQQLAKYARQNFPGAYAKGEIAGGLSTAPVTLPKFLQLGRLAPGGAMTKGLIGGATGAAAADTAYQMGQGEGNVLQRLDGTNKAQTAIAAGLGGGIGGAVGAATRPLSDQTLALGEALNARRSGTDRITPDGLRVLERFLRDKNLTIDDVGIDRIYQVTNELMESGANSPSLPLRLKDVLVVGSEGGSENAKQAIEGHLRGTNLLAGKDSASIIQKAVNEDLPQSRDFLRESLRSILGDKSRLGAFDDIDNRLTQIGSEGYEPLLAKGPQSAEGLEALEKVLETPGNSRVMTDLRDVAAGEGIALDEFIKDKPLQAAHWMQSTARDLADSTDKVQKRAFSSIRKRLLTAINEAAPGYDNVRKQYGDAYGNRQALEFGDRFLTKAPKDLEIDTMARDFRNLSPSQQEAALLSVRDALQSSVGRGKAANGPRLTQVSQEPVMAALEKVFGDAGAKVREAIMRTDEFVQGRKFAGRFGSDTASNQSLKEAALNSVQPGWRRKLGGAVQDIASDAGVSAAFGNLVPFRSLQSGAKQLGNMISGDPEGKLTQLARLLESPIAGAPTTPPVSPTQRLSPSGLLDDAPAPGAIARPLSDSLLDETITAPVDDVKAANRYFGRKSFRSENRGGSPIGGATPQQAKTAAKSLSSLIEDQANTARPGVAARPLSDSLLDETITAPVDDVAAANRYFGRKSFRSENRGAVGLPKKRLSPDDPELGMLAIGGEAGQIKSAQRAGYQGEDAGEAKEWVNASLKGLDMSQGARMQRARDMGFDTDTVLYHGTASDFKAFDSSQFGKSTTSLSAKQGVWLSDNSQTATGYSTLAGLRPVDDLIKQSEAAEKAKDWDKANDLMRQAEELDQRPIEGRLVMPVIVRGRLKVADFEGAQYDPDDIRLNDLVSEARSEGFAGLKLLNFSDEADYGSYRPATHVVIFDPSNIRSVNAAFDPDNAKSANLLGNVRTGANGVLDSPLPYMAGAGAVGTYGVSEAQKKPRD